MEFEKTEQFEKMVADLLGVKHAVAVINGTAALSLSLMALGIGKEDEVIVPDYTMIATPNSVLFVGAKPVFADIEKSTMCMDIDNLPITKKTKAIIYVSINGRSGNLSKLQKICKAKSIHLIEDSCQSLGSNYRGKALGTFGEMGCFSLTPHKIITTGQGGLIITNNKSIRDNIKKLKNFGRLEGGADHHETLGFNFKFSDLQAVIGIAQMSNVRERTKRKRALYKLYRNRLSGINSVEFIKTDLSQITPLFVDILVPANLRANLIKFLKNNNIGSRAFYPSINTQPIYKKSSRAKFPVSAEISQRGLWLPSSMSLKKTEAEYVCKKIKEFFQNA